MSDYNADEAVEMTKDIPNINSPEHVAHMETFLSALVFWQDVLQHCKSSDIRRTLLDHFQILFLQQLLYPSILESSDSDGGSSVAVLTYIAEMLVVLEETDLVEMILDYLFAVRRGTHAATSSTKASPSVEERRRFLLRTTQSGNNEDILDPSTFNLADMVRNALSSSNPQTLFAALNLHSIIVLRRPKYILDTLVNTLPLIDDIPGPSLVTIDTGTQTLLQDAMTLGDYTTTNKLYISICQDVRSQLQLSAQRESDTRRKKLVDIDDVILESLFRSLRSFLTNDVDINLALTQAFIGLLTCGEIRLDGLLTPSFQVSVQEHTNLDENLTCLMTFMDHEEVETVRFLETQFKSSATQPRLVQIVHKLTQDIQSLRVTFPKLDYILAKRSAILLTAEQRPTSSAGLSDFTDTDEQADRIRSGSRRPVSRSNTSMRVHSIPSTPGRSTTRGPVQSRSDSTPRGRTFSPQQAAALYRESSGSPTPRAKPTRSGSFMSPSRLTSAIFGGASEVPDEHPRRASSGVFLQPPPAFEIDAHEGEMLKRIVTFAEPAQTGTASASSSDEAHSAQQEQRSASLSHVLTNTVLLRSFILELAAILQLRAIVFDEARLTPQG